MYGGRLGSVGESVRGSTGGADGGVGTAYELPRAQFALPDACGERGHRRQRLGPGKDENQAPDRSVSRPVQLLPYIDACIDETSPPSTNQNAVLITPDTEIFVAPRPRKPKAVTPQVKKDPVVKPVPTASIKQATTVEPEPTANGVPSTLETARLPDNHVKLRSVPSRVFRRWPDVRERCNADEARAVGWTSRRTLHAVRRELAAQSADEKAGEEDVPVEVFRVAVSDPGEEGEREVKRVKVVLKSCPGMSDGDVALWPPVFDSSAGTLGDWEKLG